MRQNLIINRRSRKPILIGELFGKGIHTLIPKTQSNTKDKLPYVVTQQALFGIEGRTIWNMES